MPRRLPYPNDLRLLSIAEHNAYYYGDVDEANVRPGDKDPVKLFQRSYSGGKRPPPVKDRVKPGAHRTSLAKLAAGSKADPFNRSGGNSAKVLATQRSMVAGPRAKVVTMRFVVKKKSNKKSGKMQGDGDFSRYYPTISFYKVDFQTVKRKVQQVSPQQIKDIKKKDRRKRTRQEIALLPNKSYPLTAITRDGWEVHFKVPSVTRNPVSVRCQCRDFYFTFWFANFKNAGAHLGGGLPPYKPYKTINGKKVYRDEQERKQREADGLWRNPDGTPGLCKHLLRVYELIKKKGFNPVKDI